jgi:hypothetical protein
MGRLPLIGERRLNLDSGLDPEMVVARKGCRHRTASREGFDNAERWSESSGLENGSGSTGGRDSNSLKPAGDFQLRKVGQGTQVRLIGEVDDGASSPRNRTTGHMILGENGRFQ